MVDCLINNKNLLDKSLKWQCVLIVLSQIYTWHTFFHTSKTHVEILKKLHTTASKYITLQKILYCLRNNGENKNLSNQSSQSKLPLEGRVYLLYLFHITNEVRMAASYHFFYLRMIAIAGSSSMIYRLNTRLWKYVLRSGAKLSSKFSGLVKSSQFHM